MADIFCFLPGAAMVWPIAIWSVASLVVGLRSARTVERRLQRGGISPQRNLGLGGELAVLGVMVLFLIYFFVDVFLPARVCDSYFGPVMALLWLAAAVFFPRILVLYARRLLALSSGRQ